MPTFWRNSCACCQAKSGDGSASCFSVHRRTLRCRDLEPINSVLWNNVFEPGVKRTHAPLDLGTPPPPEETTETSSPDSSTFWSLVHRPTAKSFWVGDEHRTNWARESSEWQTMQVNKETYSKIDNRERKITKDFEIFAFRPVAGSILMNYFHLKNVRHWDSFT